MGNVLIELLRECTSEQREIVLEIEQRFYDGIDGSPFITGVAECPLKEIWTRLMWLAACGDAGLIDKFIEAGEKCYSECDDPVEKHSFLTGALKHYYKLRNVREDALSLTIEYCLRDIDLCPEYLPLMVDVVGDIPAVHSFEQLCIIYEKAGMYEEALDVCDQAIGYGITSTTKSGYAGRRNRLMKKLDASFQK